MRAIGRSAFRASRQIDGYLNAAAGSSVTLSNLCGELVLRRPLGASTSHGWAVPIQDVAARDIAAGDVVRLDDPQAQRVERAVHFPAWEQPHLFSQEMRAAF